MSEPVDYFANHRLKLRFPWRLYHGPLVAALGQAVARAPGPQLLNVGAGPFLELASLPPGVGRWTVCDIDERAVALARRLHGERLAGADVLREGAGLPYADGSFSFVASMEVIEHVHEPERFVRELLRVLAPGGQLFLTTPNYASHSLRLLEATALEAVARWQGFSRRGLHPTRFDRERLHATLERCGARRVSVRTLSFGWVLLAQAERTLPS